MLLTPAIETHGGPEALKDKIKVEAAGIAIVSAIAYFSALIQIKSFRTLGETVTYKIRTLLYLKLL